MTDVLIQWQPGEGFGDIVMDGADLARDSTLQTSVLISLFTERRVAPDELPAGDTGRRGFWGDLLNDDPQDRLGSRLWLLDRAKATADVLVRARAYSQEALLWLVDDGHVDHFIITAEWLRPGVLGLCIELFLPSGAREEYQFDTGSGG